MSSADGRHFYNRPCPQRRWRRRSRSAGTDDAPLSWWTGLPGTANEPRRSGYSVFALRTRAFDVILLQDRYQQSAACSAVPRPGGLAIWEAETASLEVGPWKTTQATSIFTSSVILRQKAI